MTTPRQSLVRQIAGPESPPSTGARHIIVAGTIAAGKTTLTKALSAALDLPAVTERPNANPFLERFYGDQQRWALASQLWFAMDSVQQHIEIHRNGQGAIQDHSAYENVHVFGAALAKQGLMAGDEWTLLRESTDPILDRLPPPSLVLLVEAPIDVLLERIAARGRAYEMGLDYGYLSALNAERDEFFRRWERSPVLLVDSVAIDLRQKREIDIIAATISDYLPSLG